jgi:hypothetical protein
MAAGAVLLASLQLAYALAAPQPPPSATPPPQIIDVHAHALCKVLRENVQPALAGLIQDDKDADVGRLAFEHLSADFLAHAKGAQAMDRLALANAGYALVHNLAAIDALLEEKNFAGVSAADSAVSLNMRSTLANVAQKQRALINLINGVVETDRLGQMQNEFPDSNVVASAATSNVAAGKGTVIATPAPAVTDEPAYVSVAGLPNSAYDAVSQANAHSQTLLSSTVYGKAADLLARQQRAIAWDERTTLAAILPAVTACGGASH